MLWWVQWLKGRMLVDIAMSPEGLGEPVHFYIQLGNSVELVVVQVIVLVTFDMNVAPLNGAVLEQLPNS